MIILSKYVIMLSGKNKVKNKKRDFVVTGKLAKNTFSQSQIAIKLFSYEIIVRCFQCNVYTVHTALFVHNKTVISSILTQIHLYVCSTYFNVYFWLEQRLFYFFCYFWHYQSIRPFGVISVATFLTMGFRSLLSRICHKFHATILKLKF